MTYSGGIFSQDIHFSQFFNAPMLINPANTGSFDGDWQASAGYRNQWKAIAQPFRTLTMAYERQFYVYNQHISGGVFVLNDNSGNIALKSNQIVFSGAYHRTINNNQLHGGLQIGYVHKAVDFGNNTFPDQWDPNVGYYNPAMASSIQDGDRLSYLNINFGLMWRKKIAKFEPEIGFSLYHLNHPKESFYNEDVYVPLKEAIHIGVKYDLIPNLYIQPRLLLMNQLKAKDYIIGTSAGYTLPLNSSGVREINAGIYFRNTLASNTDAMIVMVGTSVRNFNIGISYDLNVSPLKAYSNNRGAFEITLIYRSISTVLNTFTIPCERF